MLAVAREIADSDWCQKLTRWCYFSLVALRSRVNAELTQKICDIYVVCSAVALACRCSGLLHPKAPKWLK